MNTNSRYDLIVLGGGPAGYSAAVRGAQLGAAVLLVEKNAWGGTCLNKGCIPTKLLWETLHLQKKIKRAGEFGITAELKASPFSDIQQKKNRTIDLLSKSLKKLLESHAITLAEGTAAFTAPDKIVLQGQAELTAEKIIIAAGSRPSGLKGLAIDHQKIIDSDDALGLTELPGKLLIIGGGVIGVELATVFAGFGSSVLLIEKEPHLLPGEDSELAEEARKMLERQGVKVQTGAGSFEEFLPHYDKVLVATGRQSNADTLALEKAGIEYTRKGITVSGSFETSARGVYAAGDVTGAWNLAYISQAEGIAAAEIALGRSAAVDYSVIPRVVFSMPPMASVGKRERELAPGTFAVGRFPIAANSRSSIAGERAGWVKILADTRAGTVLGGTIVGNGAEELIAILSLAVRHSFTIDQIRRELFFHPSVSETLHMACEDVLKQCVDLPKK